MTPDPDTTRPPTESSVGLPPADVVRAAGPRPTDDQLRRFLAGTLSADEADRVAAWVEAAPDAADALARLERPDTLAAALAHIPGEQSTRPRVPKDLSTANVTSGGDTDAPPTRAGATATGSPAAGTDHPSPDLPAGYQHLGELGRGGMGVVYRARDLELDREVAVKVLGPNVRKGSSAGVRFRDEARITGQLQHPGIPPVYRMGVLPDGRPFLAMKLIKGRTLADLLATAPAGVNRLAVFEGVCQAVGYAHAHGVIHRDLKPGNIMVGTFGEVQVMDWGLAKVLTGRGRAGAAPADPDATRDPDPTHIRSARVSDTEHGSVLGTPAYMAPEQAIGAVDRLDRRTDVFGLGGILSVLLTGRPPYVAADGEATRQLAARAKLADCFARLDASGAEPELVALCKRCLAAEPEERPADGRAVADAVGELRAAADERARRAETAAAEAAVREAEGRKRRRVVWAALGAVMTVLVGGVVGTGIGLVVAESRRREADEARGREAERARGEARAKGRAVDVLDVVVSEVTGNSLATQNAITPEQTKLLEEVLPLYQEFAAQEGDDETTRARTALAALRVGLIEGRLGRGREAVASLRIALVSYQQLAADFPAVPPYRFALSRCHNNLGHQLAALGERAEAQEQYERAMTVLTKLATDDPAAAEHRLQLAGIHTNLGILLADLGKRSEAEGHYEQALALQEKLAADFPTMPECRKDLASTHNNLAVLLKAAGEREKAAVHHRRALALQEKLVAEYPTVPEHRLGLAATHNNLGLLLTAAGQRSGAKEHFLKAVALHENLAADYPAVPKYRKELANTQTNLGDLLRFRGEWAEAQEQYQNAVALQERLVSQLPAVPEHRMLLARLHGSMGILFKASGRPDSAEEQFKKAVALQEKLAADFPTTPECRKALAVYHNNLGVLLVDTGNRAEAEGQYRKAVTVHEGLVGDFEAVTEYRVNLGGSYGTLGDFLLNGGNPADSLTWFQKAIDTLRPVYEKNPEASAVKQLLGNCHAERALAYDRLEKYDAAMKDWDKAVELSEASALPHVRADRVNSKLRAGLVAEAVAEVAELRKVPFWDAGRLYDFACVYAVASGKITEEKQDYADRAMELLQKAVKAGYKDAGKVQVDKDLDPLRDRDDFKKLLAGLEKR